ncbi:MAG: aminotransferase class III-fold pyridoxal phosphate-dependent enzyme [Pseudomonadota bacterium]
MREAIAIVGLACRFPMADSAADYWRLLAAGTDAVADPPSDRPESEGLTPAGYVSAIDRFDAGFFGMRAAEAETLDPQHRMLLEVAWHALENAGYANRARRPRQTGVFLGLSTSDYEVRFRTGEDQGLSPQTITGNARSIAPGRLAHWLDTTGPAVALDTACSSSLVAVHAACLALRTDACTLAIAGGVNVLLERDLSTGFAAAGMLSPDHRCKTFDASANGYVRGEGCGLVVLKRLSDAERDGDRVRAIIRGGATNHDGHASALTAPNAEAQIAVIRAALSDAGLTPDDVQAVECHGTGTPLGDPIEVRALAEAYGPNRSEDLLIGSAKTNLGHLEAAAGIAGLIKLVLALEANELPPTLHQSAPNPRIDWQGSRMRVIDRLAEWPKVPVRRGGVSSFGFSGTNAHMIVEQAPATAVRPAVEDNLAILPLSAPDPGGIARLASGCADLLEQEPTLAPADISATLAIEREHFRQRAAVAAADKTETIADLRAIADREEPRHGAFGIAPAQSPKVVFLFTGQGSQWSGMGSDLYDVDAEFRSVIDECSAVLDRRLDQPLTTLMFDPAFEDRLIDTAIAQPALFSLEYALAKRFESMGVRPDLLIGHSLGEWVAACLAGVVSLDDALNLVAERGRLMGSVTRPGAMAAVFANLETIQPFLESSGGDVGVAAINGPDDVVVSGDADAVDRLCEALEAREIGCQRLRVGQAFHSPLMEPVLDAFGEAVAAVPLASPRIPIVSNLTGTADAALDTPDYWVRQIREPVRFAKGLHTVADLGANVLVEIGAAPVLIGMAQRSAAFDRDAVDFVPTLRRNRPAAQAFRASLCKLYVAGVDIDWSAIASREHRVALPGYPFADQRYWVPRPSRATTQRFGVVSAAAQVPRQEAAEPQASPSDLRDDVRSLLMRLLQLDAAAIDSDAGFFELGVDSLALTEAVAAIERRWKVSVSRQELFENQTSARRLIDLVVEAAGRPESPKDETTPQADKVDRRPSSAATDPEPAAPATGYDEPARSYLERFSQDYVQRNSKSRQARANDASVLADSRAVAGFRPDTKSMLFPVVGAKASGSHMTDLDGNDYVDITMGFGVQLFGHNPPFVAAAIERHLADQGLFIGPQAPLAGDVAHRIARLTGNDRVLFCNTGTEAVMTALRLARFVTGRSRVAMFAGSYHGHFDGTLASPSADGAGMPLAGGTPLGMVEDVIVLDYGDPESAIEILQREAASLAAVIVEPVQSRRPGLQPRSFLQRLRALTSDIGAALVFDEVLLGFRVALGGAQEWADVRADLVTYGKIIGGGLPIGVVSGKRDYLDAIDGGAWSFEGDDAPNAERTFFAGTFNKNPLTMTTAHAVLEHLERSGPALQSTLSDRTAAFCAHLNAIFAGEESLLRVDHFSSLFRFAGTSDVFFNHLIRQGVYVWEGRTCFLSTAHTDADLERVADAVHNSVKEMQSVGLIAGARLQREPETIPLTAGQHALWVLAAFSPETSAAYNQSLVLDLAGVLDRSALEQALSDLVGRHDSLHSGFSPDGHLLVVHEPRPVPIEHASLDQPGCETEAAWLARLVDKPFDLQAAPLLRVSLLRLAPDHHRLALVQPHIATDGWSMQVLAVELGHLYTAARSGIAADLAPPTGYRAYAEHAATGAESEAAAHWLRLYDPPPPDLTLPADRPRPPLQSYAGDTARRRISAPLADRLSARARDLGCSLYALCLAGYARLLTQLSGQDDLAIAVFSAGQPLVGSRTLTGFCLATLPVRISGIGEATDETLVATARRAVADALAYRNYPFSSLVKALGIKRDPSRPPLAAVSFNLDRLDAQPEFAGLSTRVEANAHGSVRWDLNWNIWADENGLEIEAHFATALFDKKRVDDWTAAYVRILEALVGEPDKAPLPSPPAVDTLARKVAEWCVTTPNAVAVLDQSGPTTYAELHGEAVELAQRLSAAGIIAGDRVAFRLERGLGPVVAMLAAGQIGAAFVPLDPQHPAAHQAAVVADSGARTLIDDQSEAIAGVDIPVISWRKTTGRAEPRPTEPPRAATEDLAYVLYTSGSTGLPKGVRVPWRAVGTYVPALLERLGTERPTSFAIVTSFAADLGYTSVFGALWCGGTLQVVGTETARDPHRLQHWFCDHPVDVLKIVPTHMAALISAPGAEALLPRSALVFGGDVLTYDLVGRMRALGGSCRIFNHYGPTETTIGATMFEVPDLPDAEENAVPIGRPLSGYSVDIVDGNGSSADEGRPGEIRIAGPGVAMGYTVNAGSDGFGVRNDGSRAYATGDRGLMRTDGVIEFLGRMDDMVKIRGHRVDPAGLSALLRSHPDVREAVVLPARNDGREPRLVAAAVSDARAEDLRAWLADRVPAALCPARITLLERLPLTANGKLDRAGLLAAVEPTVEPRRSGPSAPVTDLGGRVETIREIWQAVLDVDGIGPEDDFFALGGDSISAIQVAGRARVAGLALSPTQIFEHPTPASLATVARPVSSESEILAATAVPVPLTPIQNWFMGIPMVQRDRWALTAVFDGPISVTRDRLSAALAALLDRHDALRTALVWADGDAQQQVLPSTGQPVVISQDQVDDGADPLGQVEDALADQLIETLDLTSGRVLAAGLIARPSGYRPRIVVAVHHFAFDLVSWGILAEDLASCLTADAADLPDVPTAWSWWCGQQNRHVDAVRSEDAYWRSVEASTAATVPVDQPSGDDLEGDAESRTITLLPPETHSLLTTAAETYGLQSHEIVLAAVARSITAWTGAKTAIELEGHGRQPVAQAVDLSRTVGWFTARYPVVVSPDDARDTHAWLIEFKEAIRGIPNRGVGYGLLRHLGNAALGLEPQVSFNFAGDLNRYGDGDVVLVRLGAGRERDPAARRPHLLAITSWLDEGRLHVSCQFGSHHSATTIERLVDSVRAEAAALIEHCTNLNARVYTPSDFADVDLTQDDLDLLISDIAQRG